jgi:hypothetical protein
MIGYAPPSGACGKSRRAVSQRRVGALRRVLTGNLCRRRIRPSRQPLALPRLANVVAPDRLLDRARGVGRLYGADLDGRRAADARDAPAGEFWTFIQKGNKPESTGSFVELFVDRAPKVAVSLMISMLIGGDGGIRTLDTALDRITV